MGRERASSDHWPQPTRERAGSTSDQATASPPSPAPVTGTLAAIQTGASATTPERGFIAGAPFSQRPRLVPWSVSVFQHLGDRKTQEDRYCIDKTLDFDNGRTPASFFGVFDGTVGDFASENVKDLVLPKLAQSPSWVTLKNTPAGSGEVHLQEQLLKQTLDELYRSVDDALLQLCSGNKQHYATCTSVTVLALGDLLAIGHVGDSRIILGKEVVEPGQMPQLVGEQLTMDHKPDMQDERERIEQCGGSVERLPNHQNKPFIRGGDFLMRKALGEQPMQLQYSRAFGAKDLKIFGLTCIPDVKVIRMGQEPYRNVRLLILASDGLWDVLSAQQSVTIAFAALKEHKCPAEAVVNHVIKLQQQRKARSDNVTAVVVHFDRKS